MPPKTPCIYCTKHIDKPSYTGEGHMLEWPTATPSTLCADLVRVDGVMGGLIIHRGKPG
jgi:hypothetical protein